MRWNPVWVTLLLLLSGCAAKGHTSDVDDATRVVAPSTSAVPTVETTDPARVPKYHPHDLWGDRASILIFEGKLTLGSDLQRETYYREGALVSGYQEFDPRSDGDDADNPMKADVVFQGTKALVVKVSWVADQTKNEIPGLTFLYKPANSAHFTAVENVQNGAEVYIPLSKGMADMPHQMRLSRWRFALEAYDPTTATAAQKVYAARGEASVMITALNGGQKSIDPPHPYNFLEGNLRPAGEIQKSLDALLLSQDQLGTVQPQGEPLMGWRVDPPTIIPWETTVVHARLYYNYTGSASSAESTAAHELVLQYTDASGPEVKTPKATLAGPGFASYDIPVLSNEADDPYAAKSDWTWGVAPHLAGHDAASDFKGDVHLVLVAEGTDEAM